MKYYTKYMEYFLLAINFIQTLVIVLLIHNLRKIAEESMDRLHQKSIGLYRPKDLKLEKEVPFEERDKVNEVPLEDVSDEEFLKAARSHLGEPDA